MNVFQEYKPIRNKIALLARDDALAVIWAYSQFLQVRNFRFPDGIEVSPAFLKRNFPQQWVAEWELEVLAKEVILNSNAVATKGHTIKKWQTLSEIINSLKAFENNIYEEFGSQDNVLVELIRIAHRQFIWQMNRPSLAALVRFFRIFNRPGIDKICLEHLGLTVQQIYMCGFACMAVFLAYPTISIPFRSNIKALPDELF
jgi:TM2 domain-containing membrane protein YozV